MPGPGHHCNTWELPAITETAIWLDLTFSLRSRICFGSTWVWPCDAASGTGWSGWTFGRTFPCWCRTHCESTVSEGSCGLGKGGASASFLLSSRDRGTGILWKEMSPLIEGVTKQWSLLCSPKALTSANWAQVIPVSSLVSASVKMKGQVSKELPHRWQWYRKAVFNPKE